jgi:hypothetical protein
VVVEGGPKGIRKFTKLMTKRIKWDIFIPTNTLPVNVEGVEGNEFEMISSGENDGEFNYQVTNEAMTGNDGGEEGNTRMEEDDANNEAKGEEGSEAGEESDEEEGNVSSDDDDDEKEATQQHLASSSLSSSSALANGHLHSGEAIPCPDGRCDLLWSGDIVKRQFTGFKFQEVRSSDAAEKLLEQKAAVHYWKLVLDADNKKKISEVDNFFDF